MPSKINQLINISEKVFDSFKQKYDKTLLVDALEVANDIILRDWYAGIEDPEINLNAYAEAIKEVSRKRLVISESSIDINNNNILSRRVIHSEDAKFRNKSIPYTPCIVAKDGTPFRYYYIVDFSNNIISLSNKKNIFKNYSKEEALNKFIKKEDDPTILKCWTYSIHR